MKKNIFIIFLFLSMAIFSSCDKSENENSVSTDNSQTNEIVLMAGKYYLDGTNKDEYILIDKDNMVNLIGFDYQGIVDSFQAQFPECDFTDADVERMSRPYSYETSSAPGCMVNIRLFDNKPMGKGLYYNEDDGIITLFGKDYIIEENNNAED